MSKPRSFLVIGREGCAYRVFFNAQRGYWYAAFNDGQCRQRIALGVKTKPEAEAAVKALNAPPSKKEPERITWTEFQRRYLEFKTEQGKAPRSVLRFKAALDAFGRYLKTRGIEQVDEIALTVVEGYAPFRTKAEKCGVKTAYTDALVIKNAFKWASKPSRGLLKVNPATDWETKEPVMPKRSMYSADEVAKLGVGVRSWLRPVVITLAWSGMRIGELVNLRWKDVDLENRVLRIRVREDWKPKGRADRMIPIFPQVDAVLRQQRVGEYVFLGPKGGRVKENYALECLQTDQEKLNLPEGDLHGFRRFFATNMLQAGTNPHIVMQWGGWKDLQTMLRYLADVNVKDSVQAMEQAIKRLATA